MNDWDEYIMWYGDEPDPWDEAAENVGELEADEYEHSYDETEAADMLMDDFLEAKYEAQWDSFDA